MDEITFTFLFHGINMMIVTLGGVLSIYLGWRLYRDGIASAVESEMQHGENWKFTLRSLGPGVFFALFGMWILVTVVSKDPPKLRQGEVQSELTSEAEASNDEADSESAPSEAATPPVPKGKAGEDAATKEISLWQFVVPAAYAARPSRPRRRKACLNYVELVGYDGNTITEQDFQVAVDDAVKVLRNGQFEQADRAKANSAIAVLARLTSDK
jgi:hypothetical protein